MDVRICVDTCTDERLEEVTYVRDTYLPTAEIFRAEEHISVLSGTWNILNSLKMGYEIGAFYVFFIEEDVFVTPDYFQRHWAAQESGEYFVVCGRRYRRMPTDFFSNPGSSYRRESLGYLLPHINDDYFRDPEGYLNRVFPTMNGMDGPLDDGLIRKVQRSLGGKVLCLEPKVCSHVGFHYYNKVDLYINKGNIQERISWLREFLSDIPARKNTDPRYISDLEELA